MKTKIVTNDMRIDEIVPTSHGGVNALEWCEAESKRLSRNGKRCFVVTDGNTCHIERE